MYLFFVLLCTTSCNMIADSCVVSINLNDSLKVFLELKGLGIRLSSNKLAHI